MSGIKQHFVPQFLQRYFSDNGTHLYTYEKDKMYGAAISDNAAQRYFYGRPEDINNADDVITDFEGEQATLLTYLNSLPDSTQVNYSDELNHLILTLLYRTKSLRSNINDGLELVFKQKFPTDIKEAHKKAIYKKISIDNIKNTYKKEQLKLEVDKRIEKTYNTLSEVISGDNLKKMFSKAHNKTLYSNNYDGNKLIKSFSHFSIIELKEKIILGDSILFFKIMKGNKIIYRNMPVDESPVINIIFPISQNKILIIGENANELKTVDINKIIASCSYEKFFSSSDQFKHLKEYIGADSGLFTPKEYEGMINEIISENF